MPRPPSTKTILKRNLNKEELEPKAPIVKEMFLPNYSVVKGSRNLGAEGSVVFLNAGGGFETDNTNLFWDNSDNRLGIGTNSPSTTLEVDGEITATTYDGITASNLVDKSANETISGDWDFSGKLRIADGSAANPSFNFNSDTDTGIYRIDTNSLGFTALGSKVLEVSNAKIKAEKPIITPDVITFSNQDTTPRVRDGNVFKTNNGRGTTIVNFTYGVESQQITIMTNDSNTTVEHNLDIKLNGSANFAMGSGDTLTLIKYDDGDWHEIARMVR